jgi:surfeit locus 1 family protein
MNTHTDHRPTYLSLVTASLLFVLSLALFTGLGMWQTQRAHQAQDSLEHYDRNLYRTPVTLEQLATMSPRDQAFLPIQITGHYLPEHQWLLDGQFHEHRAGFHVITPVLSADGKHTLLINRGWVPRNSGDYQQPPTLPTLTTTPRTVIGYVHYPKGKPLLLNRQHTESPGWPKIIQRLDLEHIQRHINRTLPPFIILLHPNDDDGFVRQWKSKRLTPDRHIGYATQWFALALLAFILYLIFLWHYRKRCDT